MNILRMASQRVVPAQAGTHTPCSLDRLRGMGPGSAAGTTQKFSCRQCPPCRLALAAQIGYSPTPKLTRRPPPMFDAFRKFLSDCTAGDKHPSRFEDND